MAPTAQRSTPRFAALGAAVGLLVIAGVAWLMTGDAPKSADADLPKDPPPLALPSDLPTDSPVAAAAARLATGNLEDANRGFIDAVAEDPDDVVAQTGLILSRWSSTGPRSVERDLAQLVREYPEDAFPAVHLGFVQSLLGDGRLARETLRDARELARTTDDETGIRLARIADDLIHPKAFRGYVPVLVRASDVRPADRAQITQLLEAVERDDRTEASRISLELAKSPDPMSKVAAAAGAYSKDEPQGAANRLADLANAPGAPLAARNRATLLTGLAEVWDGEDRELGCQSLRRAAEPAVDPGTRRLAAPIVAELCAGVDAPAANATDATS